MVIDTYLFNTQHSKIRIKGKVGNPRKGVGPPLYFGIVAIEKEAFGLRSTTIANFTYTYEQINPQTILNDINDFKKTYKVPVV